MVVGKSKKKSSKKAGPKAPKAPVGRPRKKLGTRVSDLPLVSTLRPRASRSNQDSMALQRARLQFKRDYPQEKGIDDYQSRALLDAMADASRGPIGNRVLGPAQFELDKLAEKLLKSRAKNKQVVVTDGKVFVDKKAIKNSPAIAAAVSGSVAPLLIAPATPAASAAVPTIKPAGRSKAIKIPTREPPVVGVLQERYNRAQARAAEIMNQANIAEESGDRILSEELRVKARKVEATAATARRNGIERRSVWEAAQGPSTQSQSAPVAGPSGLTQEERDEVPQLTNAQEAQTLRIVNQFATEMQTKSDARIMAEAGIKAIKAAPPVVQHAVAKALSTLPEVVPSAETVNLQNTLDDMAQAAAKDQAARIAAEAARQYGRHRPSSEEQLANQREAEQTAAQLKQEREEEPVVFQPRRQATTPAPSEPEMAAEAALSAQKYASARAAQSAVRGFLARRKAEKIRQDDATKAIQAAVRSKLMRNAMQKAIARREEDAATTMQAALRGRQGRKATSDRIQDLQLEATRREIADQAVREMAAEEEAAQALAQQTYDTRREAASKLQDAVRNARIRQLYEAARDENRTDTEAATTIQAAVRSKLTRDATQKAIDRQDAEDAAIRVIQRAVRDKVEGVAKQKRIVSKIQAMNELIPAPVPQRPPFYPIAPGFTQPAIRYDDIVEETDLTDDFAREDDAARQLQAALRRFGDRSRFAKAREIEAEYAAQDEIEVPGANIRPNTRTIPVPPPMPPRRPFPPAPTLEDIVGPIDESEVGPLGPRNTPKSGFSRQGLSVKGLAEAAKRLRAFEGQQSRISDFSPGDLSEQVLREQRGRLKPLSERNVAETVARAVVRNAFDKALAAKFANTQQEEDEDTDFEGYGLVGGVIRHLRGMGYFNSLDNFLNPVHGTPMDNKKLLADAKAAYAARGGTFDGRTDFRVLMDAMKTIRKAPGDPNGGAMGGSVVLSGVPTPITGSGKYTLQAVTFPDKDWKSSSSLRWLRSNGIKPIKKADRQGSLFRYRIVDPKGFNDYYTSELMSRGRKINLVYGSP